MSLRFAPRNPEDRLHCSVMAIGAAMAATQVAGSMIAGSGAAEGGNIIGAAGQKGYNYLSGILDEVRGLTQPWIDKGRGAFDLLSKLSGVGSDNPLSSFLLKPFNPSMEEVEASPGYQFRKTQGLNAVSNSAAARGLVTSGNALKGAGEFTTGLAQSQWQQDFNNYWTNRLNVAQILGGQSQQGEQGLGIFANAAAQIGGGAANQNMAGAQGRAAGTVGEANAIGGGLARAGSTAGNYALTDKLMGMYGNGAGDPLGDPLRYQKS